METEFIEHIWELLHCKGSLTNNSCLKKLYRIIVFLSVILYYPLQHGKLNREAFFFKLLQDKKPKIIN